MAQPLNWQKSSFSGGGPGNECVELAAVNGEPLLRESDEPAQMLSVTPTGLAALLHHLQANRP